MLLPASVTRQAKRGRIPTAGRAALPLSPFAYRNSESSLYGQIGCKVRWEKDDAWLPLSLQRAGLLKARLNKPLRKDMPAVLSVKVSGKLSAHVQYVVLHSVTMTGQ